MFASLLQGDAEPSWALPPVRGPPPETTEPMRLVFTTECNRFQHWQAQTLLASALDVGQQGSFTHIVVGCERAVGGHAQFSTSLAGSADGLVPREEWMSSVHPNVSVHFAPLSPQAQVFPWFNKPWGIRHWARTAPPLEKVVVLLDPDQFFLSPLTHGVRPSSTLIGLEQLPAALPSSMRTDRPRPGLAVRCRDTNRRRWTWLTSVC